MATATFGVNRHGFSVLEVTFDMVKTDDTRSLGYDLIESVCGMKDEPFGEVYHSNFTEALADTATPYRQYWLGDNLVWVRYDK